MAWGWEESLSRWDMIKGDFRNTVMAGKLSGAQAHLLSL